MKKYSILGISLVDYTARGALRKTDQFMQKGALSTVTYITADILAAAAKDEIRKKLLEQTDMTLCVEPDVLEAAGAANVSRIREIEERTFLKDFLKKLARMGTSVYLLADDKESADVFGQLLTGVQEDLKITGCRGYTEFDCQPEKLMNDLNDVAPGVIISRMTWPVDLELMHQGKKFLNAELWIALPEKKLPGEAGRTLIEKIRKKIFTRKVNEYNEDVTG